MIDYAVLTTDWNKIKNLADFNAQWPTFSADVGIRNINDIMSRPSCCAQISDLDGINGLAGYHDLSGKHISELESADTLLKNDLFIISQNTEQSEFRSKKLKYDNLSAQLLTDMFNAMQIKSMARRDSYEFAVSSHNHNDIYTLTNISVNPIYDNTSDQYIGDDKTIDVCSCWLSTDFLSCDHPENYQSVSCNPAHMSTKTGIHIIKVPKITPSLPPRPAIGTLRFIGSPMLKTLIDSNMISTDVIESSIQVNPYDNNGNIRVDYDGWVFANGIKIQNKNNALSDAARVYGESASGINIPVFNQFFKVNTGEIDDSLAIVEAQIGLKPHTHITGIHDFTGKLTLDRKKTEMYSTDGCNGGKYVHNGDLEKSKSSNVLETPITIDFNTSEITGVKTTRCAKIGDKPQPAHNVIPVMVYIGGETMEYFENNRN